MAGTAEHEGFVDVTVRLQNGMVKAHRLHFLSSSQALILFILDSVGAAKTNCNKHICS